MTPKERVKALCLDSEHKGDCVCAFRDNDEQLLTPQGGPWTCNRYPQQIVPKGLPVDPSSCHCAGEFPWKAIGIAVGIGLAAYLGFRWWSRKRKANSNQHFATHALNSADVTEFVTFASSDCTI